MENPSGVAYMGCARIRVISVALVAISVSGLVAGPCRGDEPTSLWQKAFDLPKQEFDEQPGQILGSYVETRFSPDGGVIAGGYRDGRVLVWDAFDGHEVRAIQAHEGGVRCLAFSPRGDLLATAPLKGSSIRIWNLESGQLVHEHQFEEMRLAEGRIFVHELVFTADARDVIVFGDHRSTSDISTSGQHGPRIPPQEWWNSRYLPRDGVVSPDRGRVLLFMKEGFSVWDLTTGRVLFDQRKGPVRADRQNSEYEYRWSTEGRMQSTAAFSHDGRRLAVVDKKWNLEMWDVDAGRNLSVTPIKENVLHLTWSHDSRYVAVARLGIGENASRPMLIDARSGEFVGTLEIPPLPGVEPRPKIGYLEFSPDGRFIAGGRASRDIVVTDPDTHSCDIVWDAATRQVVARLKSFRATCPRFSPDSKSIVTTGPEPAVWRLHE
jgi:WD40 repeat protein